MADDPKAGGQEQPNPGGGDDNKTVLEGAPKADDKPAGDDKPKGDEGKEKPAGEKPAGEQDPGEKPGDSGNKDDQKPKGKESEVPEKYELKLPEKSPLGADDLKGIEAEAKALGLSQEEASMLVTARHEAASAAMARFLEEAKTDKVIGGDRFEESLELAFKGRDVMFPEGSEERAFITKLFEQGYGNHRMLIRGFARIGRMVSEDGGASGGKGGGGEQKTAAEKMYPSMAPKK